MNYLGDLIRHARERAGLTQVELARRAGIHAIHLAMIEGGARKGCRPRVLLGLARALKIDHKAILEAAAQK